MAIVEIEDSELRSLTEELLKRIASINHERGISFTNHAEALLILSVEAWINDPPSMPANIYEYEEVVVIERGEEPPNTIEPSEVINHFGEEDWLSLGVRIYSSSLNDPRVRNAISHGEEISFSVLFHAFHNNPVVSSFGYK